MTDLALTTYDWVPDMPRGYVRDLRVRWALEEAGLPYRVQSVPFHERGADHFAHQPFGQVPWLTDGDLLLSESGAILLHLAERSESLMPTDPNARSAVISWLFAALNSVEAASLPGPSTSSPAITSQPRAGNTWMLSSPPGSSRWKPHSPVVNGSPILSLSQTFLWSTYCAW